MANEFSSSGIPSIEFSNQNEIDNYFISKFGKTYIDWYNKEHAGKGFFSTFVDDSGRKRYAKGKISSPTGFSKVWNNLKIIFGKSTCNLVEFLSINTIIINETGAKYLPITEKVGSTPNHSGLSYAFDRIPGIKRGYNTLGTNKTTYDLFNDKDYIKAHGNLKYAKLYKNTTDVNWKGDTFPPGGTSKEAGDYPSGGSKTFISEADFFKYRGRGFIQLTGRKNYLPVISFIQKYKGDDNTIKKIKNKWAKFGTDRNKIATMSTNSQWDELFQKTNGIIPNLSLNTHASRTKYNIIDINTSEIDVKKKVKNVAYKIAGSKAKSYANVFYGRVYQQLDQILVTEGKEPQSKNNPPDTGSQESKSNSSNSKNTNTNNSDTDTSNIDNSLPKVEGLTNFFKPTIKVDPIKLQFDERSKSQGKELASNIGKTPVIYYNNYYINETDIKSFKLSSSELIPTINIIFEDTLNKMSNSEFPLDDSRIKIFISPRTKSLRPIFMEFKISKFSKNGNIYNIKGVSNINNLFLRKFESYSNMSSFKALQEFAKKSGLGFNSNINDSKDSMTWINPSKTGLNFIKDIISRSYNGDQSFIWCYIDYYYNLNYIDVEESLRISGEGQLAISNGGVENLSGISDLPEETRPFFLTNIAGSQNDNNFFTEWKIINNSTNVSLSKGYLNKVKFYDINSLNFQIFDIDSITSEGDNTIIMKGQPQDEEFFNDHITTTYMGKIDPDNMHSNYNYSAVQNKQNIDDLQKIGIKLKMQVPNFNLFRFQMVSVLISSGMGSATNPEINKRLSGDWLIIDISLIMTDSEFTQELILIKRELGLSNDELSKESLKRSNNNDDNSNEDTTNPSKDDLSVIDTSGDNILVDSGKDIIKWKYDIEFHNTSEIEEFFTQYNINGFTGWFYKEFRNTTAFTNDPINRIGDNPQVSDTEETIPTTINNTDDSSSVRGDNFIDKNVWAKIWNSVNYLYNDNRNGTLNIKKESFNGIEFLALNTMIWNLAGDRLKTTEDNGGILETFKSNNTLNVNKTSYKLFNDETYKEVYKTSTFSDILIDTTDTNWEGDTFPIGFSGNKLFTGGFRDLSNDISDTDEFVLSLDGLTETYTASYTASNTFEFLIIDDRESDYNSLVDKINSETQFNIESYISNRGFKNKIKWSDTDDLFKSVAISSNTDKNLSISSDVSNPGDEFNLQGSDGGINNEIKTDSNEFITECDFYKFRWRGWIRTLGRNDYKDILKFIREYNGDNKLINSYKTKWFDKKDKLDDILIKSKNSDWDKLFTETDYLIPIVSLSNFMFNNSKVNIINPNKNEEKILKSITNIGTKVAENIGLSKGFVNDYVLMVKNQIEWLDSKELTPKPKSDGPNPVLKIGIKYDISNLEPGDSGGGSSKFEIGSNFGKGKVSTVIFEGVLLSISVAPFAISMVKAARADGINIKISSGFRTNEDQFVKGNRKGGQNYFYDIWSHTKGKHYTYTKGYKGKPHNPDNPTLSKHGNPAAFPGSSNHQSGIAIDLSTTRKGTDGYAWLVQNAWKYGFTRSVSNERWHWEYRPGSRMFDFVNKSNKLWDGLPEKFGLA